MNLWNKIKYLGVDPADTSFDNQRRSVTNKLNALLFFFMLAITMVDTYFLIGYYDVGLFKGIYKSIEQSTELWLLMILSFINFGLLKNGRHEIVKLIICLVPPAMLLIFPLWQYGHVAGQHFWYPFAPIPFLLLPVLLFDVQESRIKYYFCIAYNLALIFFSKEILDVLATEITPLHKLADLNLIFFKVAPLAVALFLFLAVQYLVRQVQSTNEELQLQNKKLYKTIDELSKTQNHLIQSEKMATIGRMSAELTHELNTPVSAIKGNIEMMQRDQQMIYQLWVAIGSDLLPTHFQLMIAFVNHAISKNEWTYQYQRQVDRHQTNLNKLRKLDIPSDRIDAIAEFLTEFEMERYEQYLPLFNLDCYNDILELVYCEYNVRRSLYVSSQAVEKGEKLINKLKVYSFHKGWDQLQPFSMTSVVKSSLSLFESKMPDVNLTLNLASDLPEVTGVEDEVVQVCNNLISNALQVMNFKGDLTLSLISKQGKVVLEVLDSGGGVKTDSGQDIFEPFFTTKEKGKGTGLGLNICKVIVEKHDGKIYWENVGAGAKFTLELPHD